MYIKNKLMVGLTTALLMFIGLGYALPQQDHPLQSKTTGTVNLSNWQENRAYGLRNFERVLLNFMGVNAEHVRQLTIERNYDIDNLPAVKSLIAHKALDAIVILKGDKIEYEYYANAMTVFDFGSTHSH